MRLRNDKIGPAHGASPGCVPSSTLVEIAKTSREGAIIFQHAIRIDDEPNPVLRGLGTEAIEDWKGLKQSVVERASARMKIRKVTSFPGRRHVAEVATLEGPADRPLEGLELRRRSRKRFEILFWTHIRGLSCTPDIRHGTSFTGRSISLRGNC